MSAMLIASPSVLLGQKTDTPTAKTEAARARAGNAAANSASTANGAQDTVGESAAAAGRAAGGSSTGGVDAEFGTSDGKGGSTSVKAGSSGSTVSVPPAKAPGLPSLGSPSSPTIGVPSAGNPVQIPGLPTYDHATYVVVVPGIPGISKKVCASGTSGNDCKVVSVPAVESVTLTVSYSANVGVAAPTFTPAVCTGGLMVSVAGLAPGAQVTGVASGNGVSATVGAVIPGTPANETVSVCDA